MLMECSQQQQARAKGVQLSLFSVVLAKLNSAGSSGGAAGAAGAVHELPR
jgi:hypothetical protein